MNTRQDTLQSIDNIVQKLVNQKKINIAQSQDMSEFLPVSTHASGVFGNNNNGGQGCQVYHGSQNTTVLHQQYQGPSQHVLKAQNSRSKSSHSKKHYHLGSSLVQPPPHQPSKESVVITRDLQSPLRPSLSSHSKTAKHLEHAPPQQPLQVPSFNFTQNAYRSRAAKNDTALLSSKSTQKNRL